MLQVGVVSHSGNDGVVMTGPAGSALVREDLADTAWETVSGAVTPTHLHDILANGSDGFFLDVTQRFPVVSMGEGTVLRVVLWDGGESTVWKGPLKSEELDPGKWVTLSATLDGGNTDNTAEPLWLPLLSGAARANTLRIGAHTPIPFAIRTKKEAETSTETETNSALITETTPDNSAETTGNIEQETPIEPEPKFISEAVTETPTEIEQAARKEIEQETLLEVETNAEPESAPNLEPEAKLEPEPEPDLEPEAKPEPEPEPEAGPVLDTVPPTPMGTYTDFNAEARAQFAPPTGSAVYSGEEYPPIGNTGEENINPSAESQLFINTEAWNSSDKADISWEADTILTSSVLKMTGDAGIAIEAEGSTPVPARPQASTDSENLNPEAYEMTMTVAQLEALRQQQSEKQTEENSQPHENQPHPGDQQEPETPDSPTGDIAYLLRAGLAPFPVPGDVIIGREPDAGVLTGRPPAAIFPVPSPMGEVSRSHCAVFAYDPTTWGVIDLGSVNGTYLRHVDGTFTHMGASQHCVLADGDIIVVGEGVNIEFRIHSQN
ncbi:MAG: hypothetical protein CSA82_01460 [Actinobacteria bacterium]|nr:MAG: hypothetical protein CSA82_01460 [Actinomycetota bacterium]